MNWYLWAIGFGAFLGGTWTWMWWDLTNEKRKNKEATGWKREEFTEDQAQAAAQQLMAQLHTGQPTHVMCNACNQVFDLNDPKSAYHHMQPEHHREVRH